MPVRLAQNFGKNRDVEVAPQRHQISWLSVCVLALMGYLLIVDSLKLKALEEQENEKRQVWRSCLTNFGNAACSLSPSHLEADSNCTQLLDCIRDGESMPAGEKMVFLLENTLKQFGTICVPMVLGFWLLKQII